MSRPSWLVAIVAMPFACHAGGSAAGDPRLRELKYDPRTVITVPVKRGVVTLITLDPDEAISDVASGLGADCGKADATWCIAAQAGGRDIFVKPKSNAGTANNLAVVTDKRRHAFRFVVLDNRDAAEPLHRLSVLAPAPGASAKKGAPWAPPLTIAPMAELEPRDLVAERLSVSPEPVNTLYSLAEGKASEDILPTLVFDDGRFTYFRFAGNRPLPAVFDVLADDSETLVNARMDGDLLVVDRVSRRLVLRAGAAVVGIWNDSFDPDGRPPSHGTVVQGVHRMAKTGATP